MDDGLIYGLSVVGGILVIICAFIISAKFKKIAEDKGYDGDSYFWYCLLFGIVGMLMVVALPDKNLAEAVRAAGKNRSEVTSKKAVSRSDDLPDL